jgi:hypothetical protein
MTLEGRDHVALGQTNRQAGIAPLPAIMAGQDVEQAKLLAVAQKIAGIWEELAPWLSPSLFSSVKMKEIQRDYNGSFCQALAMLETWKNKYKRQATCQVLIQSLCQVNERSVATEVFGHEVVDYVEPFLK